VAKKKPRPKILCYERRVVHGQWVDVAICEGADADAPGGGDPERHRRVSDYERIGFDRGWGVPWGISVFRDVMSTGQAWRRDGNC
jgi:hypothetical protein